MYTILVAVDGSEPSERAVRYVAQRTRDARCKVHLLHVEKSVMAWEVGLVSPNAVLTGLRGAESARVLDDGAKHFDPAIDVATHAVAGDPAATILDLADKLGANEIVVGYRGLHPLGAAVLGSVATSVVHEAKVAVVVVR